MSRMKYCPRCASPLEMRHDGGRDRQACPDGQCGYMHFGDFSIGCAAVVLRHEAGVDKALLVQRGQEPFAGSWQIPGGYAENDELLVGAVEREVMEESSIVATVQDVIAFRHMTLGPSTNMYMICRLEYVSGEPAFDGVETADAGFYSLAEMASMQAVQGISKWAIRKALDTEPGRGLTLNNPDDTGKGWQLFGV